MMTIKDIESKSIQLFAKQAVYDCIVQMATAVDRVDSDIVRAVFWPEGRIDSGPFSGTIDEYLPYFEQTIDIFTRTTHAVSNIFVEVDGDKARAQTYLDAYHEFLDKPAVRYVGRYLDRAECRDGEWRLIYRRLVLDWFEGVAQEDDFPISASKRIRGARKPKDPWYIHAG